MAGPSVWNSLPDNLRDPAVGSDSFRRSLKMFFVCDVLRHAAHSGFYENALYKFTFTYLLTYRSMECDLLSVLLIYPRIFLCVFVVYRRVVRILCLLYSAIC